MNRGKKIKDNGTRKWKVNLSSEDKMKTFFKTRFALCDVKLGAKLQLVITNFFAKFQLKNNRSRTAHLRSRKTLIFF